MRQSLARRTAHREPIERRRRVRDAQGDGICAIVETALSEGHDLFKQSRLPSGPGTCNGDYRFGRDLDGEGCVEIGYWRA